MKIACTDKGTNTEHYYAVADNYDFSSNNADDVTLYSDAIEIIHDKGVNFIGEYTGYKDWMCHRDLLKGLIESKGGSNYSTYVANLSADEKSIAVLYVPTKIVDNLGYAQLITDSGSSAGAENNIGSYIIHSENSRTLRYSKLVGYAYQRLGKNQGLLVEDTIRIHNLNSKYKERGVLRKSEDGVDGFEDYFTATDGFSTDGLLAKLNDETYILIDDGSGQTNQQFVDVCIGIFKDGNY